MSKSFEFNTVMVHLVSASLRGTKQSHYKIARLF